MPPTEDPDPFESTEEYYASHRPGYGERALRYLVDRFELDGAARVLDLGCGAGQIAVPLGAHAGEVVGMDPNETMLRKARERARTAGRENVEFVAGSDADLGEDLGPFRLTTMGRAFHRVDQERTLERLYRLTEPGGGVALLGDPEWLTRGTREWQDEVYALAGEYLEELPPRTGPVEYDDDPWDEKLAAFGFADVETATFEFEREWTVDDVVGYVFSLSFCSPRAFGDDREDFEADLRARLAEREAAAFRQDAAVSVISGRRAASSGSGGRGESRS